MATIVPIETPTLGDRSYLAHDGEVALVVDPQRDIDRVYGTSFTTLRTRIRLRAAVAYLQDGSVTETAHLVGYASASAFVSAFTKEFGQTPGAFLGAAGGAAETTSPDHLVHPSELDRQRRLSPAL